MIEIIRIEGKVFLIFLKLFMIKISKKGIKKLIIVKVNVDVCEIFIVFIWLGKLSVFIILIGILIVLNVLDVVLVIKYNIVVCNGLKLSCVNKSV